MLLFHSVLSQFVIFYPFLMLLFIVFMLVSVVVLVVVHVLVIHVAVVVGVAHSFIVVLCFLGVKTN